jgi:hypothetical protein
MLASILPGLRDLRAPLVAGYTFLIALWLLVAPSPKAPSGNGGYALLYRLGQFAGETGVTAASAIVAYFIGLILRDLGQRLSTGLPSFVISRFGGKSAVKTFLLDQKLELPRSAESRLTFATLAQLYLWLRIAPAFKLADVPASNRNEIRQEATQQFIEHTDLSREISTIVTTIPLISSRMRELDRGRFDEFDKHRAEAEFREALVPATLFLAGSLCYRWSAWWLTLLVFTLWLGREARRLRLLANTIAIEAVMHGPSDVYPERDSKAEEALEAALAKFERKMSSPRVREI